MTSPLASVLAAVETGVTTRSGIVARTGLDPDVVDAAVDHLLRMGRVCSPALRTACPTGGCAGCGDIIGGGCAP